MEMMKNSNIEQRLGHNYYVHHAPYLTARNLHYTPFFYLWSVPDGTHPLPREQYCMDMMLIRDENNDRNCPIGDKAWVEKRSNSRLACRRYAPCRDNQNFISSKFALSVFLLLMCGFATISCTNKSTSHDSESTQPEPPEITLELSPSENNPRNSEGDFVDLKDGRMLFIYSRYVGDSSSDHAPASLAARYSSDGGQTWTSEDEIVVPNEGGMNVMSVSLLRLQNGDIALFYLRKNSTEDCIPMMRISKDEANSWGEATPCITDKEGYFVLNNDRVIQLKDGRLMMAVALHNTPGGEWSGQADLFSYYSDDNGQTWTSSEQVPNSTDIVTQEPGLIEMKDGRVMMYIRASGGFQQLSYSSDRGQTWSPIETSNIPSPLSPATIESIPGTEDWLMVWNNNDGSDANLKGKRTPITMAVSKDEGKTWNYIKNIEEDPDGWYCYIAIHFPDNSSDDVMLSYCAGNRPAGTGLSVTHVTRLTEDWVYQDSQEYIK